MHTEHNFDAENQALLQEDDEKVATETASNKEPRRNTKKSIIAKIKQVCEEHNLPLEESDTTLLRSSKTQLQRLLAKKTEELIQKKLKHSVMKDHTEEKENMREMMCVATLNYGLQTLNKIIDRTANAVLPRAGYRLDHFEERFMEPRTQQEIVEILKMIVHENPDMVEHIASPYLRLAIVYVGCVSMSLQKVDPKIKHGTLRRRPDPQVQPVRDPNGGQPPAGKELHGKPPVPRAQ